MSQQTSKQYSSAVAAVKRSHCQHNLVCYQPGALQPAPLALRRCPVSLPFSCACALQEFASLPDSAFKPVEVDFDMSVRRPPLRIPADQLGIGSEEDSLRNVLNLIPKRKPVNYNNYLENFDKVRTNPAALIAFPPARNTGRWPRGASVAFRTLPGVVQGMIIPTVTNRAWH